MNPLKIKEDIYWVGGIDWDVRNFHGYLTQRGTTYNSYLIIDDKVTLIDGVKSNLTAEMLERISKIINPKEIDLVVSNHVEMDHSGAIPEIMNLAKNATICTSPNGEKGLKHHYNMDWKFNVVKTGDSINIGKKNLQFLLTPMVHWPDNMMTYCAEDKILFSNDAFGQHIATSERLISEYFIDIVLEEAKKYYANIVLPYSNQVKKALEGASAFDIEMIAPSHGLIWDKHIDKIIENYKIWSTGITDGRALIIFDTMWNSTEKIAYAIQTGFENRGIYTKMLNLKHNHISDIMTHVLSSKYICVGSPTLNRNLLPSVSGFLSYFCGLAPKGRVGLSFGSYGWASKGVEKIETALKSCDFDMMENISCNYIPDENRLKKIREMVESSNL